jgi:hypothetical protein
MNQKITKTNIRHCFEHEGFQTHRDMTGPVDLYDEKIVCAISFNISEFARMQDFCSAIKKQYPHAKNVAFYKFTSPQVIRLGVW